MLLIGKTLEVVWCGADTTTARRSYRLGAHSESVGPKRTFIESERAFI
jgi:hypothetical protein